MIEWSEVYFRSFNLHQDPRPQIVVHRQWQSQLLSIETSKIGSWDFKHIGWVVPIVYTPQGIAEGRYRRLYIGRQLHTLQPSDLIGSLEIKPKLWIPDLTVRIWEGIGYQSQDNKLDEILAKMQSYSPEDIKSEVYGNTLEI